MDEKTRKVMSFLAAMIVDRGDHATADETILNEIATGNFSHFMVKSAPVPVLDLAANNTVRVRSGNTEFDCHLTSFTKQNVAYLAGEPLFDVSLSLEARRVIFNEG